MPSSFWFATSSTSFVMTDRLKTSRPGKSTEITFSSSGCASICPFAALKEYISRSETLRSRSGEFVSKLFLSFIRPYHLDKRIAFSK